MARRKPLVTVVIASVIMPMIMAATLLSTPVGAVTSTVSIAPSSIEVKIEKNFNISITVSDVLDLYGWEFTLTWDPYLLEALSILEGGFLKNDDLATFFTYNISSNDGKVIVDCTLLGWISGVSGSGVLATVTFSSKNYGECPLALYEVKLTDSSEQSILCQTSNGYVSVVSPHDTAVNIVGVSPVLTSIGNPVNVSVTIQNQGDYSEAIKVTVYVNSTIIGTQETSLDSGSSVEFSFIWDTADYIKGDYLIHATVDPVPGEVDLSDNTMIADNLVTILTLGHDVGVLAISPTKTAIGQGYSLVLAVKVRNYGVFTEPFNVTAYANTTAIGTCSNLALTSGTMATITFIWNTTGIAMGSYRMSAYAWPVQGETALDDNTLIDGTVWVGVPGDVTGPVEDVPDGKVDMRDIALVCSHFMRTPSHPEWNPNMDINDDAVVNMRDIAIACSNFGITNI